MLLNFSSSGIRALGCSALCLCSLISQNLYAVENIPSPKNRANPQLWLDGQAFTDPYLLREMASKYDLTISPVYFIADPDLHNPRCVEFVGTRGTFVFKVHIEGTIMSTRKIGTVVDATDARMKAFENSVLGSRSLIGFENESTRVVTAVLQSGKSVFTVEESGSRSYSILPVGFSN